MSISSLSEHSFQDDIATAIENLEKSIRNECRKAKLKNKNFYEPMPDSLNQRVAEIVDLNGEQAAKNEPTEVTEAPDPIEIKSKQPFNESTLTEILDKELQFDQIDLHIEPPPKPRKIFKTYNWAEAYLRQTRKDRVIWPSKIYNFEKKFANKTLFEQAEQLTDLAAEEFVEWINTLGSDDKNKLTTDMIKTLFAIGIEGDASKALYVEPKRKRVVSHEVAQSLNMPELSIDHNVKRLLASDKKEMRKKRKPNYAFGTALPQDLKKCQIGPTIVQPDKVNFPHKLRTCEVMFLGIHHLTSTKTLAQHLIENPDLPRPTYLREKGLFEPQIETKSSKHIPLYQYFMQ